MSDDAPPPATVWHCAKCGSTDVIADPLTPIDPRMTTGRCKAEKRQVRGDVDYPARQLVDNDYAKTAREQLAADKAARQRLAVVHGSGNRKLSTEQLAAAKTAVLSQWDREAAERRKAGG